MIRADRYPASTRLAPMLRLLRIIVPLLLAVALPLQGVAATTMRFCLPVLPVIPASDRAAHAAHGHGTGVHGGAHDAAADLTHPHAGDAGSVDEDASATPIGNAANGTCSVCAACSAAALPAAPLPQLADAPEDHLGLPLFEPHIGVTPGGLERPPRFNLA
jgi:hypothetical protein